MTETTETTAAEHAPHLERIDAALHRSYPEFMQEVTKMRFVVHTVCALKKDGRLTR